MKETKNYPVKIDNKHLLRQISLAKVRLYNKIINLDIKSLNISEYSNGALYKKIIKILLNAMIQLLGRRGMFFAPYYVVCANAIEKDT